MPKTLALVLLALLPVGARASILAGPILNPANGHAYFLLTHQSWSASEAEAITLGGHLASIPDAAEDNWVYTTFNAVGGVNRSLWIGLNDAAVTNQYQWSDGSPVTYTHWSFSEPNHTNGVEHYVHVFAPSDPMGRGGLWNDIQDSGFGGTNVNENPFGVAEVAPEPSSVALVAWLAVLLNRRRPSIGDVR